MGGGRGCVNVQAIRTFGVAARADWLDCGVEAVGGTGLVVER